MADINHQFRINGSARKVYDAVATPAGLDSWWTKRSSGTPTEGNEYELGFGPQYDWRAVVYRCIPVSEFGLEMTRSDADWRGTRVSFHFLEQNMATQVRFAHVGWQESNEHFRISCYCWAMYLRCLKRYVEYGEVVNYEDRLEV